MNMKEQPLIKGTHRIPQCRRTRRTILVPAMNRNAWTGLVFESWHDYRDGTQPPAIHRLDATPAPASAPASPTKAASLWLAVTTDKSIDRAGLGAASPASRGFRSKTSS
jgi:hypothetical protein